MACLGDPQGQKAALARVNAAYCKMLGVLGTTLEVLAMCVMGMVKNRFTITDVILCTYLRAWCKIFIVQIFLNDISSGKGHE